MNLKVLFKKEEERKGLYRSSINNSDLSPKYYLKIYDRSFRPRRSILEVKYLQENLSYLMKDGRFYKSPLTFDNINEHSRIDYYVRYSKGNR